MSDIYVRGGSAFPLNNADGIYPGMSLLDYFAGQVAPGCMAAVVGKVPGEVFEEVYVAAVAAYRMADALVAESERRQAECADEAT